MKRVLIITYYWPPTAGSGVQRWLKMSKYLPEYGWQPVIYTPANPEASLTDESLLKDIGPEVEVVKHPILEPYSIFNALAGKGKKSGGKEGGAVNPINAVGHKSPLMRLSLWLRANVFVPDPRCFWIRPSVRFLRKYLREHPVDAVVSTGPPHSMHLIARQLHRKTGIPWTADFRDPWTRIFYFKHLPLTRLSARRYAAMELSVLREADQIVAVTDNMIRDFTEELGLDTAPENFHVVENGYDENDFKDIVPEELPGRFNIVHTGLFSAEGNPRKLWKVLAGLCRELPGFAADMRLTFAGKTDSQILDSVREAGLEPYITDLGYVPHHKANRLQKAADLLLLPLREEPEAAGILTGKYFEYLAAGRPIVAFGPHDSVLERSLDNTRTGRLFGWDEETALREYISGLYTGNIRLEPDARAISAYTRRSLTGRIAGIIGTSRNG